MDFGNVDRVVLDDRMVLNDQAPLDIQTCENEEQRDQARLIAKEYEALEAQKAEFKELQEDHQKQVHEFEDAKVEFEDKLRTLNKTELENYKKLSLLRAEQLKFNTEVKALNERLKKAREATKSFNKKSQTLRGKLKAARKRELCFFEEYKNKQNNLMEREQRLDEKAKHVLEIQEKFFDPERELYEFLQSDLSKVQNTKED
ncbi:hypothetical protein BOTCAL_0518g00020 [Botryotinia calthae]|uniref:Uncharacterized protein n=1 Tax=Botryotinia calthae TaxID=38488 RepID=A0A4Y8CNJ8_9HELO|nr:hypothetical protein BOTCAL_0518g00020 [Botryotinia calthae]